MTRHRLFHTSLAALLSAVLIGCARPQMDMESMEPPPRPAELDQLNMFVGKWAGDSEMTMPGSDEVMKSTGNSVVEWRLDDMFLIENWEADMGDMGTMKGMGIWTWDPNTKKHRTWFFSNWGGASTATATYDEATKTWHMKGQGTNPMTGKPSYTKGCIKIPDEDTMEWTWKEWDNAFCWGEPMAFKGTSRRK